MDHVHIWFANNYHDKMGIVNCNYIVSEFVLNVIEHIEEASLPRPTSCDLIERYNLNQSFSTDLAS